LTNTVLDLVRDSAIRVDQQRISNFVYVNDGRASTISSPHHALSPIVDDPGSGHQVDNQLDGSVEYGEYSDSDEEILPKSPKPWDSPSRGWPRTRLGYSEEEFEQIIKSNDPESVGSSDGRTAASIAREAASRVDEHG
jgi:hypothetical protein